MSRLRWPVKKDVGELIDELEDRWFDIYDELMGEMDIPTDDFEAGYKAALEELRKINEGVLR